jgi:hypothetical protein
MALDTFGNHGCTGLMAERDHRRQDTTRRDALVDMPDEPPVHLYRFENVHAEVRRPFLSTEVVARQRQAEPAGQCQLSPDRRFVDGEHDGWDIEANAATEARLSPHRRQGL